MADVKDKAYELHKQGKKNKEIAEILGVSINTVKSWSARHWKKKDESGKVRPKNKKGATKKKKVAPGDNVNRGGAPLHNTNALKHGGYSSIFWDTLTEEEQDMISDYHSDEEQMLIDEIKLLTVRERRLMQAINSYKDDKKQLSISSIEKKETDTKKETQTYVESNGNIVMRLENELTNIQSKKTKAIETLSKLRESRGGGKDDIAEIWTSLVLEAGDDDNNA